MAMNDCRCLKHVEAQCTNEVWSSQPWEQAIGRDGPWNVLAPEQSCASLTGHLHAFLNPHQLRVQRTPAGNPWARFLGTAKVLKTGTSGPRDRT